ncbi:hypothetical protein ID866_3451 [Astraeus odoratus]|nr:hypothetical protein ID866_3451 [Astraeus odoratus]
MAGSLLSALSSLVPPPFVLSETYDGLEYRWRFIVFRPALLQTQACLFLALATYLAFCLYGKAVNQRKADKLYSSVLPLLSQQFSKPTSSGLIADGPADFFVFSTGRRAIASLHTTLALRPRHDLLQILWQYAWSAYDLRYEPFDVLTLDFTFDADAVSAVPDFIWAVVRKSELTSIRGQRWDLTFTRTADHPAFGPSLSVLSEFADVTDTLLKLVLPHSSTSFPPLVTSALPYLRVFSITDQPEERPTVSAFSTKLKRIVLAFDLPDDIQNVLPLLEATFVLADTLASGKVAFRHDTRTKIKKVRDDVERAIKEEANKEKREEAADDRRAARRKAEEERIAKLSAAEQKKALERERKRAMKKSAGKLTRKGRE